VALLILAGLGADRSEEALVRETRIALGDVRGRLDHLAVDLARQRLFVAEDWSEEEITAAQNEPEAPNDTVVTIRDYAKYLGERERRQ